MRFILSFVITICVSFAVQAKNDMIETTIVDLNIVHNQDESLIRTMEIIDGRDSYLITYSEDGSPESKITIGSEKVNKLNESLVKLSFQYSVFIDGEWLQQSSTSMLNEQNVDGVLSLQGSVDSYQITVNARENLVAANDPRMKNKADCDTKALNSDSVDARAPVLNGDCCTVGRIRCCGGLGCCNGSICCFNDI